MAARFPDFFIIGAPKCGTTSAADYLRRYPQVFVPRIKEPRYYSSDPLSRSIFGVRRVETREAYLKLFEQAAPDAVIGEATPIYLYGPSAVMDAQADNPKAKFIVFLRNPIDVARALHWQAVMLFTESERDFTTAWRNQVRGLKMGQTGSRPYRMLLSFGSHIRRFFKQVDADRRLVVILDDFATDRPGQSRRLTEFLGVTFDPSIAWPHSNPRQTYTNWTLANLLFKHRPRLERFQPDATRVLLEKGSILRALLVREAKHEPMGAEIRQEIAEELRPEVEKLSRLLDRDLTGWLG